ncbi:MAG: hypothetical protein AAFN50_12260, partial [Pseudomonadota bacterium]
MLRRFACLFFGLFFRLLRFLASGFLSFDSRFLLGFQTLLLGNFCGLAILFFLALAVERFLLFLCLLFAKSAPISSATFS